MSTTKDIIKLVQGDSRPSLVVELTDEVTLASINITGATIAMRFREVGASVLQALIPGSIIDPVHGICIFDWTASPAALTCPAGNYEGEIEITFSDGSIQTVFDTLRFRIREQFGN